MCMHTAYWPSTVCIDQPAHSLIAYTLHVPCLRYVCITLYEQRYSFWSSPFNSRARRRKTISLASLALALHLLFHSRSQVKRVTENIKAHTHIYAYIYSEKDERCEECFECFVFREETRRMLTLLFLAHFFLLLLHLLLGPVFSRAYFPSSYSYFTLLTVETKRQKDHERVA